jgi:hypothetical protein
LLGQFGWDVTPGFYRVSATRRGCKSLGGGRDALTRILQVPPAAIDLALTLRCPSLSRAPTRTRLVRIASTPGAAERLLIAVVSRRRGRTRPVGTVTFSEEGRRLGATAVAPNGRATLAATFRGRPQRVTARYSGDGDYQPSAARAEETPLRRRTSSHH